MSYFKILLGQNHYLKYFTTFNCRIFLLLLEKFTYLLNVFKRCRDLSVCCVDSCCIWLETYVAFVIASVLNVTFTSSPALDSRYQVLLSTCLYVCMSVCLSVCLFDRSHLSKTTCPNFTQIFCKCYRWPWLGPHLRTV